MESAKVSSKSQITVPRKVRELLRIGQGDRIGFEATADGRFIIGKATTAHKSDGAARRRLQGRVPQVPAKIGEALTSVVMADDRRIREGG
jgi:AbrB family looped-hinge helix DNA binding protein